MHRDQAPYQLDGKGYHLRLDAIPAWVCNGCGRPCFTVEEMGIIQELATTLEKAMNRFARTPLEDRQDKIAGLEQMEGDRENDRS